MRNSIWTITVCIVAVAVAQEVEADCRVREDANVKPWGQLTWRDFQGGRQQDKNQGAQIATSLRVLEGAPPAVESVAGNTWEARRPTLCVVAVMHKQQSAKAFDGDYGLEHEQLHFDITETFARALMRRLTRLGGQGDTAAAALSSLQSLIETEYRRANAALIEQHGRYDAETRHGTRSWSQRKWQARVQATLDAEAPWHSAIADGWRRPASRQFLEARIVPVGIQE